MNLLKFSMRMLNMVAVEDVFKMDKKQILGVVIEIFNSMNRRRTTFELSPYQYEITEYTDTRDLPFDNFDKTMIALNIETEFHIDFSKEECFDIHYKIYDIVDLIENKLKEKEDIQNLKNNEYEF